jgi:RNA polymerase sigma-70 factor (ECF subfamily)
MLTDEALMLEFQRGSRPAFEELFERYREPLYAFFRRRLDSRQRAEDLTQETFVAVIRAASRYEPRALVRTYLYGIAWKVLAVDRRQQARMGTTTNVESEPLAREEQDSALWVREAIGKLDPVDREVVMLREYEQLSYSEIAQVLRLPVNTVRSRLFRTRSALKEYLAPASSKNTGRRGEICN